MKATKLVTLGVTMLLVSGFTMGCKEANKSGTDAAVETTMEASGQTTAPDWQAIKTKIQEKETAFAVAQSNADVEGILAFYAEDAVSLGNDQPMLKGKDAMRADLTTEMAKRAKGDVTTFDVLEVFGSEDQVTEIGISTTKDASGKVSYTGKYMAVWEKRNGDYVCIRDIYNNDAKEK